jgi:alpha-tubulin suppressor-like RCC1 family protein
VAITALSSVNAISEGYSHTVSFLSTGVAKSSGRNSYGQLGDNTTTQRSSPVQVVNLTGLAAAGTGSSADHSLAAKSNGTAWSWGRNNRGQLGNGTTSTGATSAPAQVGGLSGLTVTAVAAGGSHSLFLTSAGKVYAAGDKTRPNRRRDERLDRGDDAGSSFQLDGGDCDCGRTEPQPGAQERRFGVGLGTGELRPIGQQRHGASRTVRCKCRRSGWWRLRRDGRTAWRCVRTGRRWDGGITISGG